MRVILLKDVKGVGRKFDEKNVSDGYALNFLIPKKFAVVATKQNDSNVKQLKEQAEKIKAEEDKRLEEKEAKREAKRLELEKFRTQQHS